MPGPHARSLLSALLSARLHATCHPRVVRGVDSLRWPSGSPRLATSSCIGSSVGRHRRRVCTCINTPEINTIPVVASFFLFQFCCICLRRPPSGMAASVLVVLPFYRSCSIHLYFMVMHSSCSWCNPLAVLDLLLEMLLRLTVSPLHCR